MGKLSASILAADLANLAQQVQLVSEHVDVIHVDVMDGYFARPLTMGPIVVASLRPHTTLPLHGHLMVEAPEALFDELAEAGMDLVSFHVEAANDPGPVISKARGAGMGVGLAVSAETAVDLVVPHLDEVDGVIVTSVPPASADRGFVPEVLPKVEAVRAELDRRGLTSDLEVEGGIEADDARRCLDAGANVVVAASAIFGASDVGAAARELGAIVGPA
jgi:ribulose-phosphate 3-epimerase